MVPPEVVNAAHSAAIKPPAVSDNTQRKIWVDVGTFTVVFCGRRCFLGNTKPFRLIEFLAARINRFLSHTTLLEHVWPDQLVENVTLRTTVRDLKRRLEHAGIPQLAELILSQPGHYGLFTEQIE